MLKIKNVADRHEHTSLFSTSCVRVCVCAAYECEFLFRFENQVIKLVVAISDGEKSERKDIIFRKKLQYNIMALTMLMDNNKNE